MIIVFGSINRDIVFKAGHLPAAGETVLCHDYNMSTGGKGANQALAASRFGDRVAIVGKVGDDTMGMNVLLTLRREGVMTSGIAQSEELPTGCAVVITDDKGENQIALTQGANIEAMAEQVPDEILDEDSIVLMQMEVDPVQNIELAAKAKDNGSMTILNLAPATNILPETLNNIDILIMNEIETAQLAAMLKIEGADVDKDPQGIAAKIAKMAGLTCIITLAAKGSVACDKDGKCLTVPALQVEQVVDTTGAGDAYIGTLTACLYKKMGLEDAMRRAAIAGSLACMNEGTQDSFAYLADIEEHLEDLG